MNDRTHDARGDFGDSIPRDGDGEHHITELFGLANGSVGAPAIPRDSLARIVSGVLAREVPASASRARTSPARGRTTRTAEFAAARGISVMTAAAIILLLVGGFFLGPWKGAQPTDPTAMATTPHQETKPRTAPLIVAVDRTAPPSSPRFIPLYWRFAMVDAVIRARVVMVDGHTRFELLKVYREGLPRHPLDLTPIEVEGSRMLGHARVSAEDGDELLLLLTLVEGPDSTPEDKNWRYLPSTAVGNLGVLRIEDGQTDTFRAGLYDLSTFADPKVPSISLADLDARLEDIAESTKTIPALVERFSAHPEQDSEVFADLLVTAARALDRRSEKGQVRLELRRALDRLANSTDPPADSKPRVRIEKALEKAIEAFPE